MTTSPAGWHPDPTGRHQLRYWDGLRWTGHVRAAYDGAVDVVMRNVGTRLVADVLRTIEDGGRAAVAGVVLSRSGAESGKKHLDWSTPFRLASYSSQGQPGSR